MSSSPTQPSFLRRHSVLIILSLMIIILLVAQFPALNSSLSGKSELPDDGIPWQHDLAAALAESRATGKPVLLDVTADWCPPCQIMKREAWPDEKVRAAVLARYIPVLLNPDLPANRETLARYTVRVIPTLIVLDSAGNPLREANFLTRDQLLAFLAPN